MQGHKNMGEPTWKVKQSFLQVFLPGKGKKGDTKPKRMMVKTYINLCGHIYEEKYRADEIDEREDNAKTDFPAFLKDEMINQFGLVSIANEMLHSFVDCTIRSQNGNRARLMGMLLGIIQPHLYHPLAVEAMLKILIKFFNLVEIKEKLDD